MKTVKRWWVYEALSDADLLPHVSDCAHIRVRDDYPWFEGACFGVEFGRDADSYKFLAALVLVITQNDDENGRLAAIGLAENSWPDRKGSNLVLCFPGYRLED